MQIFYSKPLTLFILFFLFNSSAYSADAWKYKRKKTAHQYSEVSQVEFVNSGKYTPRVYSNSSQNNVNGYQSTYNCNSNDCSYQDYTRRQPFDGTASYLKNSTTTPDGFNNTMMRASNEDDPPFPGDPGQMPLSDGLWFLLGAVGVYAIYKKKSNV